METSLPRKKPRELIHRRVHSHASTPNNMLAVTTCKSTGIPSQLRTTTTAPSYAPHAYKFHKAAAAAVRQSLRLPLDSSREYKQLLTPMSSLLQEKLQQERRAESERLANKLGTDLPSCSASSGDIRDGDGPGSSHRRIRSVAERGLTSSPADDSSQGSMGAKQMEKAVSTLHKQNFDLKLELFHRREKQSSLEARVEELEAERQKWMSSRESLAAEMTKRDKAIEEAVNMIVKLETKVDELAREREMVRHLEADKPHQHARYSTPDSLRAEAPKQANRGELLSVEPVKNTLKRMPSFLSDRSVHTENLRSIVLQNRSSFAHLRQFSQVSSSSADASEPNRATSPSLSILSESSFVSIYGSKQEQDGSRPLPLEDASDKGGTSVDRSSTPTRRTTANSNNSPPDQTDVMTPRAGGNLPNVLRHYGPMLRTDKLGGPLPASPTKRHDMDRGFTKQSPQNELIKAHVMPPTPDTVSSSVLRSHKNSPYLRDSLVKPDDADVLRFITTTPPFEGTSGHIDSPELQTSYLMKSFENPLLSHLDQLAYSTAGTSAAMWPGSDNPDSDSDSDGGAIAHSDTDSYDYWMRESYKPDNGGALLSPRWPGEDSQAPDLFSFPEGSGGWEPDAMFGALPGAGFLGSPVPSLRRDPKDQMTSGQPYQQGPPQLMDGPALPSRNSSLNKHNRQAVDHSSSQGERPDHTAAPETRPDTATKRSQYPPISGLQSRGRGLMFNSLLRRSGTEKHGTNSNETESSLLPSLLQSRASQTPQPQSQFVKGHAGRASVPPPVTIPWVPRPVYSADDRDLSATPPPILRSRPLPPSLRMESGSPKVAKGEKKSEAVVEAEPVMRPLSRAMTAVENPTSGGGSSQITPTASQGGGGGVRKWLGLGKRASLMNRTK
ncbi:hypothetical protein GGR50DRAFT_447949 [Xylaria sp. CBS 124048]|nr:hypothetical protein GGR50DRAFT_447949 [Xylaria sp. CBS 124048]